MARASASAKPSSAIGCSCDWDSGWRATPLMYAAKIRPTPMAEPIAARPYPIMFNEPCSSIVFLSRCLSGRLWRVPGGDPMGTGTRKLSHGVYLTVPIQVVEPVNFLLCYFVIRSRLVVGDDCPLNIERRQQGKDKCLQYHDQQLQEVQRNRTNDHGHTEPGVQDAVGLGDEIISARSSQHDNHVPGKHGRHQTQRVSQWTNDEVRNNL